MVHKNLFLKSLLVAAMATCTTGAMAAVGDVTTNVDIDFSNAIADGVVAGTKGSMAVATNETYPIEIENGILRLGKGDNTVTIESSEYAGTRDKVTVSFDLAFGRLNNRNVHFYLKDAYNANIADFEFIAYSNVLTTTLGVESSEWYYGYNTVLWERRTTFTIELDYAAKTIKTTVLNNYTNTTANHTVGMENTNPLASFTIGSNYDNTDRRCSFDNLKITTTEGNYTISSANYTVKFVCDGTEIKTAETRTGDVGSEITLLATDTENFITEDGSAKYIYESNDVNGKTITEDGNTVVTITYTKAATCNYSVKATVNGITCDLGISGSDFEGESITFNYPRFYFDNGKLYEIKQTAYDATGYYQRTVELTETSQEIVIDYDTYLKGTITDVVYFSEAEDIATLTESTAQNSNIRCSNGVCAYNASGAAAQITTLEAGKYTLSTSVWGNSGETFTFKAGDTQIGSYASQGYVFDNTTAEFTVTANTAITLDANGATNKGIDFVYIQKVGSSTAIESIQATPAIKGDGYYYTLTGQRVKNPTRGLYIKDGKKVLVK